MLIIGPVRIDRIRYFAVTMRQPDLIVILTMAGGCMDKAGSGIVCDVVTGQHRYGKAIATIQSSQGVGTDHALAFDRNKAGPARNLGRASDVRRQLVGDQELVARLGPGLKGQAGFHRLNFIQAIGDLWIIADGAVGRHGPGRGGPDHNMRA